MKEAMTQRQRDAVTRRISNASHPSISQSQRPRVLLSLPLLLLAAILTFMPVETVMSYNKTVSELAATEPDEDWDHDGLPNSEEAEYSTNPTVNDTDGDASLDGKDGWAGGTDPWFEALLAPPRLPKARYALIDIGAGWAPDLKVNSKGQVFGYRSEGQCLWDEGEIIVLPSQESGKLIYYGDMNNKGEFIGVMEMGIEEQPKIVRWNRANGLSAIDTSPIVGTDLFGKGIGMPSLNDNGVAVGRKWEHGQFSAGGDNYWHYEAWAYLRLEGSTVTQTETYIYKSTSSPVGWTTSGRSIFPAFIKNNGRIAGTYRDIQEGGNYEIWPTGIVSVEANGAQYAIPGPAGVFSFTEQGHMLGSENSEIYMWVHKYGQYHKRSANYGFLNSRLELAEISNGSIWRNFKSFYLESLVDHEDYDFMYPMDISENGIMIATGLNASDSEYHSFLLVPIEIKVTQPNGHQGPVGSGRVYKNSPRGEAVATNLFALWPNETATIKVNDPSDVIKSLPAGDIEWASEAEGASIQVSENKLEAVVSWASPCEPDEAYIVTLTIKDNEYRIYFGIPNVGSVDEIDLPFYVNINLLANLYLAKSDFEDVEQNQYDYPKQRPKSDALKHASFAAYTVSLNGMTWEDANLIQTAHEFANYMLDTPAFETVMDLFNNAIGHAEGDPDKDAAEWFAHFEGAYSNGELMIWWPRTSDASKSDGMLRWSNGKKIIE